MRCPACGVQVVASSVYCGRCGSRVAADDHHEPRPRSHGDRLRRGTDDAAYLDDEEQLLWQGTFSWKGMIHEILLASFSCVILVAGCAVLRIDVVAWLYVAAVMALLWVLLLAVLGYRKLSVHYRVTNQRLIHEKGILYRILDRIEVIDIDDVRVEQGIVERILGVGKIRLRTSDRSDPVAVLNGIDRVREVSDILDDARRKERIQRGLHVETV